MIIVCKNCHNQFDTLNRHGFPPMDGDFCSAACEREYNDRKYREGIQTIAQVTAAAELKKQTEIMQQQQRERQAQIARENALRQAQLNAEFEATCKKYDVDEHMVALQLKHHKDLSIKEAAQKAKEFQIEIEKANENSKKYEKEKKEYLERIEKELLKNLNPEQQEKQKEINNLLLNYKSSNKDSNSLYIATAIFAVVGFIFYFVFRYKIPYVRQYGFWSTLFTFIGSGLILSYFRFLSNFKKIIKKIAQIKGDDKSPYYNLSKLTSCKRFDKYNQPPIFLLNINEEKSNMKIGLYIFIIIAVFKFFKYVHVPYVGVIARILVILIPLILSCIDTNYEKQREKYNKQYKAYAEKKLGQFIWKLEDFDTKS